MGIIVSKFGGSSAADADGFRNILRLIRDQPRRRYIVLSAPGRRNPDDEKVTDLLCRAHRMYAEGGDGSGPVGRVRRRFEEIIRSLGLTGALPDMTDALGSDVLSDPDMAASRGEALCARLFSAFSGIPFIDAARLIRFDENGLLLTDETACAVRSMARRVPCAVIPGFYGSMPDGRIRTFSRGGSDITGALIAAALNAEVYENWTDVDGLMSADPRVCPDAVCHPCVSYRQMKRFSQAGAQVLHPSSLDPVSAAGVPTLLKNTFRPEGHGTYISDRIRKSVGCVCAGGGFSLSEYGVLSGEARMLADGLGAEAYRSTDGRRFVALSGSGLGRPAVRITAFGLTSSLTEEAVAQTAPEAFLRCPDRLCLMVGPDRADAAVRTLHRLLPDG